MSHKQQVRSVSFFTAGVITTISITLVLFLLGIVCLVGFTGKGFSTYLKENMAISVEVSDKANDASVAKLKNTLEKNPYIRTVKFISKEDIKKQLIEDLGRDPEEVLGYNPSHSYYDVYIKSQYVNPDSLKIVEASLKGTKLVKNIVYNEDEIGLATQNLSKIGSIVLILTILLILISFTLIRNTIQLNIYSKRFLINTMQLVGATNSFIRRPFVIRMVLCGIIAAIIADVVLAGVVYYFVSEYPELSKIITSSQLIAVYILVLIFGILITAIATISAVNRFLRMKTNKLYYI